MGIGSVSFYDAHPTFDRAERNFTALPSSASHETLEISIFKALEAEERKFDFAGAIRMQKELENQRRIQAQLEQIEKIKQANALRFGQRLQQQPKATGFGL